MSEFLSVKNLCKTFKITEKKRKLFRSSGVKTALDDLSFSVGEQEIFGLLGPNGAGKTTAMRIIATLIKSDSGDAIVGGVSVRDAPLEARRGIGFLSLDLKLEDFFSASYLFDFFSALRNVPEKEAARRKERLFARFGINEYAGERLSALSSGMRQKVSLVVSIAHDPRTIIFDEPTNGLDILAAREVSDFLLELKAQGKTIILATHIFGLAEKICDRVGFIVNGRMLDSDASMDGSLEDRFFALYEQQSAQNMGDKI
ncbi:MAG: ABC transporter ATP-binding protein [Treponema sp.]|nr:ABC transporter ATP-binding protein [Treponema sp.]